MRIRLLLGWTVAGFVCVELVRSRLQNNDFGVPVALLLVGSMLSLSLAAIQLIPFLSRDVRTKLAVLVSVSCMCLIGLELTLRFGVRTHATYREKNGEHFSPLGAGHMRRIWTYQPFAERRKSREYEYFRKANSLGICERELSIQKEPDEFRLLALGDSFTEGLGVAYEDTWINVVKSRLNSATPLELVAINAGIAGSDPVFEYVLLAERLLSLDPDIVIVAINDTDLDDIVIRGGRERFSSAGSAFPAPWWEWLYGSSFLVRHIVHDVVGLDWLYLTAESKRVRRLQSVAVIRQVIRDFQLLAGVHGFDLVVVVHPLREEVERGAYWALSPLVQALKGEEGLRVVNVLEAFQEEPHLALADGADLYWPIDGHHNVRGYQAMGEAISQQLLSWDLIPRNDSIRPGTGR